MSDENITVGVRQGVGLFEMTNRGLLEVRGEDRTRWLDGMISGDVDALEARGSGAGCYATLLTNRGAIIADLYVARIGDVYLLESQRSEIERIQETLERFIIADDVVLVDRSDEFVTFGLEGPASEDVLAALLGSRDVLPARGDWLEASLAGGPGLVAAVGWSGERAFQLRVPVAAGPVLESDLQGAAAASGHELLRADAAALEVLRIEAGIPALGSELDDVLPPEARLEHAISTNKGCYVGQEIVARLRARGQVNHLLVGLRISRPGAGAKAALLPSPGTELSVNARKTGEITSVADSPIAGPIALGFVRREHAEVGTRIEFEGGAAEVAELPFVPGASTRASTDSTDSAPAPDTATPSS